MDDSIDAVHRRFHGVEVGDVAHHALELESAALGHEFVAMLVGAEVEYPDLVPAIEQLTQQSRLRCSHRHRWDIGSQVVGPTKLVTMLPIPSMVVTSSSPAARNRCGSRAIPTPDGVPVKMMSPGSNATMADSS